MTDPIHASLAGLQQETAAHLWSPAFPVAFTPAVLSQAFGDGRALFRFTTINARPRWWIVRGDSRWRAEHDGPEGTEPFADHADDVVQAIADEFGGLPNMHDEDADVDESERYVGDDGQPFDPADIVFPQIDDRTGCSWEHVDWPDIPSVALEPHPFAKGVRVLAQSYAT